MSADERREGVCFQADALNNCATIRLPQFTDERTGVITVAEQWLSLGFEIKRLYFITDVDQETVRGGHAHRNLRQAIFCPTGSVRIDLDDGAHQASLNLDSPSVGILLGPAVWHSLADFAPGTSVVVLASELYDEREYIRSYQDFIAFVEAEKT